MYWGAGPQLGLLTCFGYIVFVLGALRLWRDREDVSVWVHDEFSAFRRHLSRYTVVGPFYGPREESRLKTMPSHFFSAIRRFPRRHIDGTAILLLLGPLLLLLDFFI